MIISNDGVQLYYGERRIAYNIWHTVTEKVTGRNMIMPEKMPAEIPENAAVATTAAMVILLSAETVMKVMAGTRAGAGKGPRFMRRTAWTTCT